MHVLAIALVLKGDDGVGAERYVRDGRVALCEPNGGADGRVLRLRPARDGRIIALSWSPDGASLAAGTDQGLLRVLAWLCSRAGTSDRGAVARKEMRPER